MLTAIVAALVFVAAADGDTFTVQDSVTREKAVLRLAEVDAPERTQPYSQVLASQRGRVVPKEVDRISEGRY